MDLKTRINEFESLVTTKLLCERTLDFTKRKIREEFSYSELLGLAVQTLNSLIFSANLQDLRAIIRRDQAFIVYRPLGKILAEVGVMGEPTGNKMLRRPKIIIFGKKGVGLRNRSIEELINELNSRNTNTRRIQLMGRLKTRS